MSDDSVAGVNINLKDSALIEHVVARCVEDVNARIVERENQRRRSISIIYTILGLFGVTAATALGNYVIGTTVTAQINAQFEAKSEEFDARDALTNLYLLNDEIAARRSENLALSRENELRLITLVEHIVVSDTVASKPTFERELAEAVNHLWANDRLYALEALDDVAQATMLRHPTVVQTACETFAQEVIGGPATPGREPNAELFILYCDTTASVGYSDVGLFWQSVYAQKVGKYDAVADLMAQRPLLNDVQALAFDSYVVQFSEADNWYPSPQGEEIERVLLSLIAAYPDLMPEPVSDAGS